MASLVPPARQSNKVDLNEIASLTFHKLFKNMECYISIYGESEGRRLLLNRLHSAGWYAVRLGDVHRLNLTAAGTAVFLQSHLYNEDLEDWGEGSPSAVFNKGGPLPQHINILLRRIAWVHDRTVELSEHMLHDSEPDYPLDETLKIRHGEDLETCNKINENLNLLVASFHRRYGSEASLGPK